MRVGAGCAELKTAAGLALGVAAHTEAGVVVGELVGRAGLDTKSTAFVVSSSAVDASTASSNAAIALSVTGNTDSGGVVSEVVDGALSDANSVEGESLSSGA